MEARGKQEASWRDLAARRAGRVCERDAGGPSHHLGPPVVIEISGGPGAYLGGGSVGGKTAEGHSIDLERGEGEGRARQLNTRAPQ